VSCWILIQESVSEAQSPWIIKKEKSRKIYESDIIWLDALTPVITYISSILSASSNTKNLTSRRLMMFLSTKSVNLLVLEEIKLRGEVRVRFNLDVS